LTLNSCSCPYILTVGGTQLLPGLKEVGANEGGFTSAGGLSWNYSRPANLDKAVQTYLSHHENLDRNRFNPNGRGFPDISALRSNIIDFYGPNATIGLASGTSASTPIFAAVINRINEERLAVGKSRVGFVNLTFYKNPHMFNDVTEGNTSMAGSVAFQAAVGCR
jgi:tripeptidyl-peptidase I